MGGKRRGEAAAVAQGVASGEWKGVASGEWKRIKRAQTPLLAASFSGMFQSGLRITFLLRLPLTLLRALALLLPLPLLYPLPGAGQHAIDQRKVQERERRYGAREGERKGKR
eukprot:1641618-Rhodomonas_salina.1